MLDKATYNFLSFLVDKHSISHSEYFDYHEKHKTDKWDTVQMYIYLLEHNYILVKNDKIHFTYQTEIIVKYYKEHKFNSFFTTHILPYIQQIVIFLLGLLSPYLIGIISHIL